MDKKKFAFEVGKVSIAFGLRYGLGDSVVARKVFDAIIAIEPACAVDIFYKENHHRAFAEAFYGDSNNLNRILSHADFYERHVSKYDLALWVVGTHCVILDGANVEHLQAVSPKLLQTALAIQSWNQQNVLNQGSLGTSVPLRNVAISRVLHKNCFWFLSCGGALPIYDDKVNLPLMPEIKPKLDALKLGKYITVYSNTHRLANTTIYSNADGHAIIKPKAKAWSMKYLVEYVALVKKFFPALEVVQVGGSDEAIIENCDRKFLGCDLELTKYILAKSLLHVGCEGGLIHLATALGTKCLVLFGQSDWHYFSYDQNINIASEVCSPCMYISEDFGCLLGENEPPCMLNITPNEVFDATSEYLLQK